MKMLTSDVIYITDDLELMFVRVRDGWFWGKVEKTPAGKVTSPPKFFGPSADYLGARKDAWRSVIVGTPLERSLLNDVGYAWDKWVEAHSQIEAQKG